METGVIVVKTRGVMNSSNRNIKKKEGRITDNFLKRTKQNKTKKYYLKVTIDGEYGSLV